MKKTLKSIAPLQFGKISAAIYGLLSLLFVPIFLVFALIGALAPSSGNGPTGAVVIGASLIFCVVMPVVYAIMGFLMGLLVAATYNLLARWIGGIEVEVE